jgi:hypothetical protein
MYIITFIQSDSNNIDSNLCANSHEVFKKIENFFQENLLTGLEELPTVEDPEVIGDYLSIGIGCYTTIHIQALNSYSRQQLSLANQEKPLAPKKKHKITLFFKNEEPTVIRIYETLEEAKICFLIFYGRNPASGDIEFKEDGWEIHEPLKPFVVAATLPDNTEVVLGRFDTFDEASLFGDLAYVSVR